MQPTVWKLYTSYNLRNSYLTGVIPKYLFLLDHLIWTLCVTRKVMSLFINSQFFRETNHILKYFSLYSKDDSPLKAQASKMVLFNIVS